MHWLVQIKSNVGVKQHGISPHALSLDHRHTVANVEELEELEQVLLLQLVLVTEPLHLLTAVIPYLDGLLLVVIPHIVCLLHTVVLELADLHRVVVTQAVHLQKQSLLLFIVAVEMNRSQRWQ